jgi:predicted glycosyltransferase
VLLLACGKVVTMRYKFDEMTRAHATRVNGDRARKPRVAFYSQDIIGLGHLRRNLLIAQTLAQSKLAATSLMICGAHEANFFKLPEGIDCLTLPRLGRDANGHYGPARLDMSPDELTSFRQRVICAALEEFAPDLFIVDFRPTGVCDELLPALESLSRRGRTRFVLGLRDVLDDVSVVRAEWLSRQRVEIVERLYDAVWVYGDRRVFDPVREYRMPESIAEKTRFTGYLDQSVRLNGHFNGTRPAVNGGALSQRELVACVVGGGLDGANLIETFLDAVSEDIDAVVLTGPYVPHAVLDAARRASARMPNVQVLEFSPEADSLIARADRVVAMAGYNTVCSILSFGKPALLVPRVAPRREQWIRAQAFKKLNLVDVISSDELTTDDLAAWICHPNCNGNLDARSLVDLNGLDRIVEWTESLLSAGSDGISPAPAGVAVPLVMEAPR